METNGANKASLQTQLNSGLHRAIRQVNKLLDGWQSDSKPSPEEVKTTFSEVTELIKLLLQLQKVARESALAKEWTGQLAVLVEDASNLRALSRFLTAKLVESRRAAPSTFIELSNKFSDGLKLLKFKLEQLIQ
jgi:hypothetical protein